MRIFPSAPASASSQPGVIREGPLNPDTTDCFRGGHFTPVTPDASAALITHAAKILCVPCRKCTDAARVYLTDCRKVRREQVLCQC